MPMDDTTGATVTDLAGHSPKQTPSQDIFTARNKHHKVPSTRAPKKDPFHLRNGAISSKCRLLLLLFLVSVQVGATLALGR